MANIDDFKDVMGRANVQVGEAVRFKGLMSKIARIKQNAGKSSGDILGWDYIFRAEDGTCYSFYAAQAPLIGMTQPVPIPCPLGVRVFDKYEIDFSSAIDIMHTMDCGDTFVEMSLSWALVPDCTEPYWHIRTSIGNVIVVGANSGKGECNE